MAYLYIPSEDDDRIASSQLYDLGGQGFFVGVVAGGYIARRLDSTRREIATTPQGTAKGLPYWSPAVQAIFQSIFADEGHPSQPLVDVQFGKLEGAKRYDMKEFIERQTTGKLEDIKVCIF